MMCLNPSTNVLHENLVLDASSLVSRCSSPVAIRE
jgi:hypothetical protein